MRFVAIAVALVLSGCTANSYAHKNFDKVEPVVYRHVATNNEYVIHDKPAENRMKMLMGIGGTMGLLLAGNNAVPPMPLWEDAAVAYLASVGRQCAITRSFEIIKGEVEVQYTCG